MGQVQRKKQKEGSERVLHRQDFSATQTFGPRQRCKLGWRQDPRPQRAAFQVPLRGAGEKPWLAESTTQNSVFLGQWLRKVKLRARGARLGSAGYPVEGALAQS